MEDFARLTGLELGTRGGSDNAIFKLILQLNVKNNCVYSRNQFLGCGIFEEGFFINFHQECHVYHYYLWMIN